MMWRYGNVGWGEWFAMALLMVVFWGLVGTLILAVARSLFRQDRPPAEPSADAEGILARRFAQGEIDAEEYHARLEVLRGSAIGGRVPRA